MIEHDTRPERDAQTVLNEEGPWGPGEDKAPGGRTPGGRKGEPRNPWLQPPRRKPRDPNKGDGGQPSLEELIRRGRDRFAGLPGGGRPIWGFALALFVALWLFSTSMHRIGPGDRGVVTRFGRFAGIEEPGLRFTFPAPIDVVRTVNVDERHSFDVPVSGGANLLITRNQDLVNLTYTVNWSVRDPDLYLFNLPSSQEDVIRNAAEAAMREAVAGLSFEQIAGGAQADLATRVAQRTQDLLDRYHAGVLVQGITIRQAALPDQLDAAVKAIADARSDAAANADKAQKAVAKDIADARTQTQIFDEVYDAYKASPQVIRSRIYYETMEAILAKRNKVIVDAPNATVQVQPTPPQKPQGAPQ